MNKPIVLVDLDNTLIKTDRVFRTWVGLNLGVELPDGFINGNKLHDLIDELLLKEHRFNDYQAFYRLANEKFFQNLSWQKQIEPVEGAVEAIQKLSGPCEIWVATARPNSNVMVVWEFCKRLFNGQISSVHFVWLDENGVYRKGKDKDQVIREIPLDRPLAFIDDSPEEVKKVGAVLRPSLLFDPNNYHAEMDLGTHQRVTSWAEATDIILSKL